MTEEEEKKNTTDPPVITAGEQLKALSNLDSVINGNLAQEPQERERFIDNSGVDNQTSPKPKPETETETEPEEFKVSDVNTASIGSTLLNAFSSKEPKLTISKPKKPVRNESQIPFAERALLQVQSFAETITPFPVPQGQLAAQRLSANRDQLTRPESALNSLNQGLAGIGPATAEFAGFVTEGVESLLNRNKTFGNPTKNQAFQKASIEAGAFEGERKEKAEAQLSRLRKSTEASDFDPLRDMFLEAGKDLRKRVQEAFPTNPEFQDEILTNMLPRGFGQIITQIGAGVLSGGSFSTIAALSATQMAGPEFANALKETEGDEDSALAVGLINTGLSITEVLPLIKPLKAINKATNGRLVGTLSGKFDRFTGNRVTNGFAGSFQEGLQETVAGYLSELTKDKFYAEGRNLIEVIKTDGITGGLLGLILNSMIKGTNSFSAQRFADMDVQQRAEAQQLVNMMKGQLSLIRKAQERTEQEGGLGISIFDTRNEAETLVIESLENGTDNIFIDRPIRTENLPPRKLEEIDPENPVHVLHEDVKKEATAKRLAKWTKATSAFFNSTGRIPKAIKRVEERADNLMKTELLRAGAITENVYDALRDEYLDGKGSVLASLNQIPESEVIKINEVLGGIRDVSDLPERMQAPVNDMRKHIDRLTEVFIKLGVGEGKLRAQMFKNTGVFLTRDYQAFSDPKAWKKAVGPKAVNQAVQGMKRLMKENGNPISDKSANEIVFRYLGKTSDAIDIMRTRQFKNSEGSTIDMTSLFQRNEIPEPIRKLWGEEKDPVKQYINTITRMSSALKAHQFMREARDEFNGVLFFEPGSDQRPDNFTEPVHVPTGDFMTDYTAPLDGLVTTPEIASAMKEMFTPDVIKSSVARGLLKTMGLAKKAKTVGTLPTHTKNVLGGSSFFLKDGLKPQDPDISAGIQTIKGIMGKTDAQAFDFIAEMSDLGLIGEDPEMGVLREIFQSADIKAENLISDNFSLTDGDGVYKDLRDKIKRNAKNVDEFATKLYNAEDAAIRVTRYFAEKRRLQKADPTITDEQVAGIVNDTYQNYRREAPVNRALKFTPFGAFAKFQYEAIRTSVNTVTRGYRELASDNVELRKIGAKRIAGTLAQIATAIPRKFPTTTALGIAALTPSSGAEETSKILNDFSEDDEDRINRALPFYYKDTSKLYLSNKPFEKRFVNIDFLNPLSVVRDPLRAFIRRQGRGIESLSINTARATVDMISPFLNQEPAIEATVTAFSNLGIDAFLRDKTGGEMAADAFVEVFKGFEPSNVSEVPGILFEELPKAVLGEEDSKFAEEAFGLVGARVVRMDMLAQWDNKIDGLTGKIKRRNSRLRKLIFEEKSTDEQIINRGNRVRSENLKDASRIRQIAEDMEASGLSQTTIIKALTKRGLSKDQAVGLVREGGRFPQPTVVEDNRDLLEIRANQSRKDRQ